MRKVARLYPVKEWVSLDLKILRLFIKTVFFPFYVICLIFYYFSYWMEEVVNMGNRLSDDTCWMYLKIKRWLKKVKK